MISQINLYFGTKFQNNPGYEKDSEIIINNKDIDRDKDMDLLFDKKKRYGLTKTKTNTKIKSGHINFIF